MARAWRERGSEVLEALRSVAKVPIYGISGNFLGRGIVGGVLFDTQRHGSDLAQRARQILSGVRAADLVPMTSPNGPGFDWRELKRFGIDDARLPAGATVVNRDPGLWDTYKRIVLVAGAVLIGQSLLIGGLLVQRLRRRRAELALRDLGGRLIAAQEVERARIARELHDDVSQQLAALSIALSGLKRRAAAVPNGSGLEDDGLVAPAARHDAGGERQSPLARPASRRTPTRWIGHLSQRPIATESRGQSRWR